MRLGSLSMLEPGVFTNRAGPLVVRSQVWERRGVFVGWLPGTLCQRTARNEAQVYGLEQGLQTWSGPRSSQRACSYTASQAWSFCFSRSGRALSFGISCEVPALPTSGQSADRRLSISAGDAPALHTAYWWSLPARPVVRLMGPWYSAGHVPVCSLGPPQALLDTRLLLQLGGHPYHTVSPEGWEPAGWCLLTFT